MSATATPLPSLSPEAEALPLFSLSQVYVVNIQGWVILLSVLLGLAIVGCLILVIVFIVQDFTGVEMDQKEWRRFSRKQTQKHLEAQMQLARMNSLRRMHAQALVLDDSD
ncbi:hypothetical protein Bbelb_091990 [Branchiostoma belcheri]|nr:hypothetical protein Bbelb_091990 [Branchiostoma belcheri]